MSKDEAVLMLDEFYAEQKMLEREVNALPRALALSDGYYGRIEVTMHKHLQQLSHLFRYCENKEEFLQMYRKHPFHAAMIMQSRYAKHILEKPYGYPGDKDLMLKTCNQSDEGDTNYAILLNRVYLSLPAAEGVRVRKSSLKQTILSLKPGSRVFNLACGPALEVQEALKEQPDMDCVFYLADHDQNTLDYLAEHIQDERIHLVKANALKLTPKKVSALCGHRLVHLAYSSGLFDYIPQRFAPRIANAMFENVAQGGRLIVGNYLALGGENPHKEHHKNMMEFSGGWFLIYRAKEEILDFTSEMDSAMIQGVELQDEYFGLEISAPATIGFLIVRKTCV